MGALAFPANTRIQYMLMSTHVHSFDLLNLFKFGMGDLKQLLLRHLFRLAVRRIGSIRKARGGLFGIVFSGFTGFVTPIRSAPSDGSK